MAASGPNKDIRAGCKKCGYPGHLTFECRNFVRVDPRKDIVLDVSSTSSEESTEDEQEDLPNDKLGRGGKDSKGSQEDTRKIKHKRRKSKDRKSERKRARRERNTKATRKRARRKRRNVTRRSRRRNMILPHLTALAGPLTLIEKMEHLGTDLLSICTCHLTEESN
uniref:Protein SREK1IP1 n=1 Tax=Oncorhynchus tshawytscha TaxID=74940 RepID=A0AAZ3P3D7_ONCTS